MITADNKALHQLVYVCRASQSTMTILEDADEEPRIAKNEPDLRGRGDSRRRADTLFHEEPADEPQHWGERISE